MGSRLATTVVFFLTGGIFAAWASRTPAMQERLDLSAGELAIAILGIEGGGVLGPPLGGELATRIGSRATLRIGFLLHPAGLVATGWAPSLAVLTAALAVTAAATSLNDVAMNVQGVELERRARRPVLSGPHAGRTRRGRGRAAGGRPAGAGRDRRRHHRFVAGPPAIGAVAELTGVSTALVIALAAAVAIALLAPASLRRA